MVVRKDITSVLDEVRLRMKEIRTEDPRYRRGLRRWADFLQERVGYRIGYSSIRRYEEGEFPLSGEYILAVCLATDTNPGWVFSGQGPRRWSDVGKPDLVHALEQAAEVLRRRELAGV